MQAVKYALLGLLAEEPRHGYDLRSAFEELLGGSWNLNIGQVYSTLARLERDGLVECVLVPQDLVPDRKVYSVTRRGREELRRWLGEPSQGPVRLRDELFVKVVLVGRFDGQYPGDLIARQRQQHLQTLAELGDLCSEDGFPEATRLIIEGAMLHVEADLKWLDLCEQRLRKGKKR